MITRILAHRLRARLHGERGFTIIETVMAMGVILASLAAVAYTVTSGLTYIAYSRTRIQATGLANEIIEEIRALPYSSIRRGMDAADFGADANIVYCAPDYRFESCAGDKIVVSTFAGAYTADWLVPHSGTVDLDGITADWSTYVTNEDIRTNPYTVTVIVTWTGGSLPNNPSSIVRLQSKFWSPTGCQNTAVHPFAAPCQPFFYGLAQAPTAEISIAGELHFGGVDLTDAFLDLPGVEASGQQEQLIDLAATATASGARMVGSTGTETEGGEMATGEADSDPGSPTSTVGGTVLTGGGAALERLQPDCCGEIGVRIAAPAGDTGDANASTIATAADAYACPPNGTRETDSLPCSGARVRQTGQVVAQVPLSHALSALGTATVARVNDSGTYTTAVVDRDAVSGYQGLADISANRTLGTIFLGGFPTAGLSAPVGMSTSAAVDTNYCVRITGYTDAARVLVGERTSTNPSNSVSGTVFYYNGVGFSSKSVTDSTLDTQAVTCETTQIVSGSTVIWRVRVLLGGFSAASAPTPTQTPDPVDAQTRTEAQATTSPIHVTLHYDVFVDGQNEVDLVVQTDLGSLLATGSYGQPPTP
jgi:type II secretory pathway pseudopilin PulG